MLHLTSQQLQDLLNTKANKAAGYTLTPKDYTWHHHQDRGRMQLVERSVHEKTGHTGGFALWRLKDATL